MRRRHFLIALLSEPFLTQLQSARALGRVREPVVGLPCEGCEAVFDHKPEELSSTTRIASENEPGEPLTLTGRVFDQSGRPQAGVIVYAYHTDHTGIYPPAGSSTDEAARHHGRLRAWVQTDATGDYRFDSIRPGSYPGRDIPEHVHMHVIEASRATYYIDDVMFTDDPKLMQRQIQHLSLARGGPGIVTPNRQNGVWLVRRDIVLGLHVPGHPSRGSR